MQQIANTTPKTYSRTIEDSAKSIGISRAGLYRLIGEKQLRTFKVGHRTLIAESELQRFIAERMAAAA
jgi:excisionase family DNA binding protein